MICRQVYSLVYTYVVVPIVSFYITTHFFQRLTFYYSMVGVFNSLV